MSFDSLPCRYDTFCGYPPEVVKKMAKKDLAEEVIMNLWCFLPHYFYEITLFICAKIFYALYSVAYLNTVAGPELLQQGGECKH